MTNERDEIQKMVSDIVAAMAGGHEEEAASRIAYAVGTVLCDIRRIAAASERMAAALKHIEDNSGRKAANYQDDNRLG